MPSLPARTSIAAIVASTLLLAGCSDDSGKDDDKKSGDGQEETSQGASSPGTTASSDEPDAGTGALTKEDFFDAIIEAQQEAGSYKSTSTTSNAGVTLVLEGEAVYEGDELSAKSMTTPESAQQIESVLADGVIYLRGDGLPAPAGKWIKIDPEDPATADSPYAALGKLADPKNALAALDDPKELTLVGTETVEGVETSHYRVVTTSASYVDALDLPAEAAQALPDELVFDIWLDEENRTIKLHQELDIQGQKSVTDQVYSDYGTPVTVDVPAPGDTISVTEVS